VRRVLRENRPQPPPGWQREVAEALPELVAERTGAAAALAKPVALADVLLAERASGPAPGPAGVMDQADYGLRFSYPWLTVALLLGGLWSMSAYATPWRGQPAEIWLAVSWLIGGAYLYAVARWQAPELPRAWAHVLAVVGLLAALLAAWGMPALAV
jgi:hypothetical protein